MRIQPALVLVVVLVSAALLPMSVTGVSVALPEIGPDLSADLASVQWVATAYHTAFASSVLAAGALADRLGVRRCFAVGLAIWGGAGVAGGFADDIVQLDLLRVVGGVGGALAAASSVGLLAHSFPGPARTRVFGLFGIALGVGMSCGPWLAGLLVEGFGWRSVFVVLGALGLVLLGATPLLPDVRHPRKGRFDWIGTGTFAAALALGIFAFVQGPAFGWTHPLVVGAFVGSPVLLALFVTVQRRRPDPMIDLTLLAQPRFVGILTAAAAVAVVVVPMVVYLPSYLTGVVGMAPGAAGATTFLITAPALVLPLAGAALLRWFPDRAVIVAAVVAVCVGAAGSTVIGPDSTTLGLALPLLTMGVGIGLSMGLLDRLGVGSVGPTRAATGSGLVTTARMVSETVGIAVVGSVLAGTTGGRLTDPGFTGGLRAVLWTMAGVTVVAAVVVAVLVRHREPSHPAPKPPVSAGI
ncbi:MFS transporter [Micromonospora sp. SH-82]|uniref:MFS transporter n=1 Tax=Micromonospora sp. SH-82 TaxID=3132938 RepID=UPI003EB94AE1